VTIRSIAAFGCCVFCLGCLPPHTAQSGGPDSRRGPHSFVTDDVVRFIRAFEALPLVADTAGLLDSAYLARGSPGLRAYAARYPLNANGLATAIARYPADYAGLAGRLRWLEPHLDSLSRVLDRYRELYPAMTDLPVYFVVGEHGGINSGSEVGPLHTLENGAATPERRNLSELLAHEVTHIQQFSAVGLPRYRTLYTTRPSLLGVVVREGIAEFMAELVTGGVTQRRAQEYFTPREDDIWREFRAQVCATSTGEWAGSRPRDPARPSFLGYALGAGIARSYHSRVGNTAVALRTLLTSDDYQTILLESGYIEQRGDNREDVRAALASCRPAE